MIKATNLREEPIEASREMARQIEDSLTARNYKVSPSGTDGVLILLFTGEKFEIKAAIFCGADYLTIQASLPIVIPEPALPALLARINELNVQRPVGAYEIHTKMNKLLFKVGVNIPPVLNGEELESLLNLAVGAIDSVADEIVRSI